MDTSEEPRYSAGGTGLSGRSYQVFAYFAPNGPAHVVSKPSTFYTSKLQILRNLIIQEIMDRNADSEQFDEILQELRLDEVLVPILLTEVAAATSLPQLAVVLMQHHESVPEAARAIIANFEVIIKDLDRGVIRYYNDADSAPTPVSSLTHNPGVKNFDYDVALSFAGENRAYVDQVAGFLKEGGLRVFYDRFEEVNLWGKNLSEHLRLIYKDRARFTVIFGSKEYASKAWTTHEFRSAQERAITESREYVLPARFDSTPIPGLSDTTAYIDLSSKSPMQFAAIILKKVHSMKNE